MLRRFSAPAWVLAGALSIYLLLAFSFALVKIPWVDEGWVASAPANWAATGKFGTPSLEPTGSWLDADLTGIREYTYWNMPVGIAAQGVWYRLIGFSILKMRALGILAGFAAIVAWFGIVQCLTSSRWAAAITASLLALDYTFLWSAADGRMDMLCIAFGSLGLAAYLRLRERNLLSALWAANSLLALSLFTHPNGALFVIAFGMAFLHFDRSRVRWQMVPTLLPYFFVAALWGIYILQRPDYFVKQFSANASALGGSRWGGLMHPLKAIESEIICYLTHYGFLPLWVGPVPRYVIFVPFILWSALLVVSFGAIFRKFAEVRLLVGWTWFFLIFMTFFTGLRPHNYLSLVLPMYLALVAVWTTLAHAKQSVWGPITVLLIAWVLFCDVSVTWSKIRTDAFQTEYQPAVEYLRGHLHPGGVVFGDSYFGFSLGFGQVIDDARLGFYSGRQADFVIEDLWYSQWWNVLFAVREPDIERYIRNQLHAKYHPVWHRGGFRIYERNSTLPALPEERNSTWLQWFMLDGKPIRQMQLRGQFLTPVMAPHDTGILLTKLQPGSSQLYYFDFATRGIRPLLEAAEHPSFPVCSDALDTCALALRRESRVQMFHYQWASGSLQRIMKSDSADLPDAFSPDGAWLAFTRHAGSAEQFWLRSEKTQQVLAAMITNRAISEIQFSPDGRHVSFTVSDEGRTDEDVYMAEFAGQVSHLMRVSPQGGHTARWASNTDLLYVKPNGTLTSNTGMLPIANRLGYVIDRSKEQLIVLGNSPLRDAPTTFLALR